MCIIPNFETFLAEGDFTYQFHPEFAFAMCLPDKNIGNQKYPPESGICEVWSSQKKPTHEKRQKYRAVKK